jgi:hypothetical protein
LRAQGKLREALASFTACASDRCPPVIRDDCRGWRAEVETAVPTVVVRATAAEDGTRELFDVQVKVDGAPLADKLDGGELPVNPGEHQFAFSAEGRVPVTETVVVRVGEKHRLLTVVLHPTAPIEKPPPAIRPRVGTAAKVLLAVGGAALVTSAGFGTSGWLKARSLRSSCAPGCEESEVASVRTRLRVADVSLGVGVAALAGAAWFIWGRSPEVAVVPLPGGAMVGLRLGARR